MKTKLIILVLTAICLSGCGNSSDKKNIVQRDKAVNTSESMRNNVAGAEPESAYPNKPTKDDKLLDGMSEGYYRPKNYEKFFTEKKYQEYLHTDLNQWVMGNGNYDYPKDYEILYIPSQDLELAKQQFPKELLEKLSTKELLDLIMKYREPLLITAYDHVLDALSEYRSDYNFIDEIMTRADAKTVVKDYYSQYSQEEVKKYSRLQEKGVNADSQEEMLEADKFQLIEGLHWYFMKQDGQKLPDEEAYQAR